MKLMLMRQLSHERDQQKLSISQPSLKATLELNNLQKSSLFAVLSYLHALHVHASTQFIPFFN